MVDSTWVIQYLENLVIAVLLACPKFGCYLVLLSRFHLGLLPRLRAFPLVRAMAHQSNWSTAVVSWGLANPLDQKGATGASEVLVGTR